MQCMQRGKNSSRRSTQTCHLLLALSNGEIFDRHNKNEDIYRSREETKGCSRAPSVVILLDVM